MRILNRIHELFLVYKVCVLWTVHFILLIAVVYFIVNGLISLYGNLGLEHPFANLLQAFIWFLLIRVRIIDVSKAVFFLDGFHRRAFGVSWFGYRGDVVTFLSHHLPPLLYQFLFFFLLLFVCTFGSCSYDGFLNVAYWRLDSNRNTWIVMRNVLIGKLDAFSFLRLLFRHSFFQMLFHFGFYFLLYEVDFMIRQVQTITHLHGYFVRIILFEVVDEIYHVFLSAMS